MPEGDIILGNSMPSIGSSLALAIENRQKEKAAKAKADADQFDYWQKQQETKRKQAEKNLELQPEYTYNLNGYSELKNAEMKRIYDEAKSNPDLVSSPEFAAKVKNDAFGIIQQDKQVELAKNETFKRLEEYAAKNANFDLEKAKTDATKRLLSDVVDIDANGVRKLKKFDPNVSLPQNYAEDIFKNSLDYAKGVGEVALDYLPKTIKKNEGYKYTDKLGGVKKANVHLGFANEVVIGKDGKPEVVVKSEDENFDGGSLKMLPQEDFALLMNAKEDYARGLDKKLQDELKDPKSWIYTEKGGSPLYNGGTKTESVPRNSPIYMKLLRASARKLVEQVGKGYVEQETKAQPQTTINKVSVFTGNRSSGGSGFGKSPSDFVDGFAKIENVMGEGKSGYKLHRVDGVVKGALLNNLDAKVVETLLKIANNTSDAGAVDADGENVKGKQFGQRDLIIKRNDDGSYTLRNAKTYEELPRITKEDFNLAYNETLGNDAQEAAVKEKKTTTPSTSPTSKNGAKKEGRGNFKTKEEFKQLSLIERSKFINSGGKIK